MNDRIVAVAVAASLAFGLAACGDEDDQGSNGGMTTWQGSPRQDGEVEVGAWEGSSGQLTIVCSANTVTIEVPGYVAEIERPDEDGPTEVTVEADDGQAITWGDDGAPGPYPDRVNEDDAVMWTGDVITNDELVDTNGLKFALNEVELSCAR